MSSVSTHFVPNNLYNLPIVSTHIASLCSLYRLVTTLSMVTGFFKN